MYCEKCGTQMTDGSRFCPSCGAPTANAEPNPNPITNPDPFANPITNPDPFANPNPYTQAPTYTPAKKSKAPVIIGIVAACVVLILGGFLLYNQMAKASLQKQLLRDWSRVETEGGVYYTLELDFSDDEIEYIFDSYYYDSTIAVMDYEVVSGNQIRVDGSLYTLEFNDDKTMLIIYPALTSSDYSEYWFHLE